VLLFIYLKGKEQLPQASAASHPSQLREIVGSNPAMVQGLRNLTLRSLCILLHRRYLLKINH
jgi:hypothetical protein